MKDDQIFEVDRGMLRINRRFYSFDEMPVVDARRTRDNDSAVVLLNAPSGAGRVRNLLRVDRAGNVIWRAELPDREPTDSFTAFEIRDGAVSASTWSGHRVLIEMSSGRIVGQQFTK